MARGPKARLSWTHAIEDVMAGHGESWAEVVACTLSERELDDEFDPSYGHVRGRPFGVWTVARVYFPVSYDGAEYVASVPRDPSGPIRHIGGGHVQAGLMSDAVIED
jgi:hypothetical protein